MCVAGARGARALVYRRVTLHDPTPAPAVWSSVYGYDMSCIRDVAMLEPLVDTVNGDAVCTDHAKLWTCDISTVQKKDLTFECPWTIVAKRNDYVHVRGSARARARARCASRLPPPRLLSPHTHLAGARRVL